MQRPADPPSHSQDSLDRTALLMLIVLCALWGLGGIAIKVANTGISPVFQAGLRSTGSAILLAAWCRWRGVRLFERDGTGLLGLAAGTLFAAEFVFIYWGLDFTTASHATVFLYISPFVVAIGAHWFIPGDRLTAAKVVGLLAAFAGIVAAFSDTLRITSRDILIGDIMTLLAAIAWGSTTVLIKASRLAHISAERTLMYQLVVSAPILLAVAALLGERGVFAPTPLVLAALAYHVVIIAFASYAAWFWLVRRHAASQLAAFIFLTPIYGVAFAGLLLGEPISPALIVAVMLVALGIYLVNRPGRAKPAPAATIDQRQTSSDAPPGP